MFMSFVPIRFGDVQRENFIVLTADNIMDFPPLLLQISPIDFTLKGFRVHDLIMLHLGQLIFYFLKRFVDILSFPVASESKFLPVLLVLFVDPLSFVLYLPSFSQLLDHTHEVADIEGLQDTLDELQEKVDKQDDFISFVMTDLISSLIKNAVDGKADADHTHTISDITDFKVYDRLSDFEMTTPYIIFIDRRINLLRNIRSSQFIQTSFYCLV